MQKAVYLVAMFFALTPSPQPDWPLQPHEHAFNCHAWLKIKPSNRFKPSFTAPAINRITTPCSRLSVAGWRWSMPIWMVFSISTLLAVVDLRMAASIRYAVCQEDSTSPALRRVILNALLPPELKSDAALYSHGAHVWDFDQDGFPDLVVTGYGGQSLYRNLGDGTFEDCTSAAGWTHFLVGQLRRPVAILMPTDFPIFMRRATASGPWRKKP